eukprot:2331283-Pyramimonas_sp.AAC.1
MEKQLLAMHWQVEQLQRELREAKQKPLAAADEAGAVEADVVAATRARIAELDGYIEHLARAKPMP